MLLYHYQQILKQDIDSTGYLVLEEICGVLSIYEGIEDSVGIIYETKLKAFATVFN